MTDIRPELRRHQQEYAELVHGPLCGLAADQIDALVEALAAMVDRWEPDCGGQDRVMWENACAALALATADPVGGVSRD